MGTSTGHGFLQRPGHRADNSGVSRAPERRVPEHPDRVVGSSRLTGRRRFLVAGLGTGVAAGFLGSTGPAGAAPAETLWRLNPAWGFPAPGSRRCECDCRACVTHAANKIFFTRADAETGRAHLGCVCLAEPVELAVDMVALRRLSADGRSVDRRHDGVAAALAPVDSSAGRLA